MTRNKKSTEQVLLKELEARILTGQMSPGDFLPSERNLADELKISRPVVHNILIRLEERGLINIIPRQGARVIDYKKYAPLSLINGLVDCYGREISHSNRDAIINLLKGHTDMIIADISRSEYKAKLELVKDALAEAMREKDKCLKAEAFVNLYKTLAQAAVNPFYLAFVNSCEKALRDIGVELVERDSAYHTLLRLFTSLLHQLKTNKEETAYALNETIFQLIFDIWQ
ncbi:GntR family transcriptional regulator [Fusibacter sp. JL216-2]|uniref:GntR family transcriptional regulator n=1 Tax=Fusibacter sp. JL216-2 TaxID=3071453 RepID=UPI003D326AB4